MKVNPPFLNIFLREHNNIMLLLMFRVKWRVVFLIPFTGLYYYIHSLPIYMYCIYIYHREWLTTHTIMSSEWYFSMNPKLNIIIIATVPIHIYIICSDREHTSALGNKIPKNEPIISYAMHVYTAAAERANVTVERRGSWELGARRSDII